SGLASGRRRPSRRKSRPTTSSPPRLHSSPLPGAAAAAPWRRGGQASVTRFYLESYGCQMNVYDTQGLERLLTEHGYARVAAPEDAQVILVNTCSVREHAEERTLNRLAQLARLKALRPEITVGVCGCMAQRLGESIRRRIPAVDLVVGARALPAVLPA